MNEYTKSDSQRSLGCEAAEGGQRWPLLLVIGSIGAFLMMVVCVERSRDEGWHKKQTRFHAPTLHLVILFQVQCTNMLQ